MNSKSIIIVAAVILVLILVPFSIFFLGSGVSSESATSSTSSKSSSIKSTTTSPKLTLSGVAKHNTQSDCYMIVNSKVYDVTSYLPNHPGGAFRIIQYCGKDGTQAFDTKGGEGQHSNRANTDLSSLYKGDLAN